VQLAQEVYHRKKISPCKRTKFHEGDDESALLGEENDFCGDSGA
jgi:hypothetical protein